MPLPPQLRLSVLDLAPVVEGSCAAEALRRSTDLARRAEWWGYHRYWVAEHHNMPGIASSSPAVLVAHLAAATSRIRVGSGGVMLPNHAPLVVAEQFGMLEALHPGRIDLGLGRAPGTDRGTAAALRRSADGLSAEDFPRQLGELLAFFDGAFPEGHPYAAIHAVPAEGNRPEVWLLGSSGYSAQVAGLLGLPFAFAHHFSPENTLPALELYRERFQPSAVLEAPYVMVGASVVAAPTAEQARHIHGPTRLAMVRLRSGRPGRLPTPEEAASHVLTPGEERIAERATAAHVVGSPEEVEAGLAELARATDADELMVTTMTHSHADRLRSFELVAGLRGSAPGPMVGAGARNGHTPPGTKVPETDPRRG